MCLIVCSAERGVTEDWLAHLGANHLGAHFFSRRVP